MTDAYETLIDAALYPGAYKAIVKAVRENPKALVSVMRETEDAQWELAHAPYTTTSFGVIAERRASGVYTYPANHGLCGRLEKGMIIKTLYQAVGIPPRWQQNLITLLYMPDGLPYGCNRFTGILKPTGISVPVLQRD